MKLFVFILTVFFSASALSQGTSVKSIQCQLHNLGNETISADFKIDEESEYSKHIVAETAKSSAQGDQIKLIAKITPQPLVFIQIKVNNHFEEVEVLSNSVNAVNLMNNSKASAFCKLL